jgi:hypothetical protein
MRTYQVEVGSIYWDHTRLYKNIPAKNPQHAYEQVSAKLPKQPIPGALRSYWFGTKIQEYKETSTSEAGRKASGWE